MSFMRSVIRMHYVPVLSALASSLSSSLRFHSIRFKLHSHVAYNTCEIHDTYKKLFSRTAGVKNKNDENKITKKEKKN